MNRATLSTLMFALLAVWVSAFGQENRPIGLYDFSGGLNTFDNWANVAANQSYQCRNWVLDDPRGALTVRPGYHAVTDSLDGYDKVWSIYSHRFPTGDGFLFQTLEREDSGWCDVYVSRENGYDAYDSLGSYLYPGRSIWLSWLGEQFIFNGHNRPRVITGGPDNFNLRYLFPGAPGQIIAEPNGGTSGNLDGDYIYGYVYERCDSTDKYVKSGGTLSAIVHVGNGQMRLSNITAPLHALNSSPITCYRTYPNDAKIILLRTRAYATDFESDSLFAIDTLDPVAWEYVDTLGTVNPSRYYTTLAAYESYASNQHWNAASTLPQNAKFELPGQPRLENGWTGGASRIVPTIMDGKSWDFLSYFVTVLDTKTGAQSDSGRAMLFQQPSGWDTTTSLELTIPQPYRTTILYRAHGHFDSTSSTGGVILTEYYPVDTIPPSTFVYLDTTSYATLTTRTPYTRGVLDAVICGAIVHEAKMWAWDNHRVYSSNADTASLWSVFDNIEFDMDDGDRIVGLSSHEGYIVVYKTRSVWLLYTADGEVYDRKKVTRGLGMISPYSLDQYFGANIFLGLDGVYSERDNPNKDNAADRLFLSDPIKPTLLRSPGLMVGASGRVFDSRYFLSYPGTDSTFVYFFNTGGWSTWDFDFMQAILYDTLAAEDYTTFNQLCFIADDDERVFVLDDNDTTDDGRDYTAVWEKRGIARNPWGQQVVRGVVLQQTASVASTDSLSLCLTTEQGDSLGTLVFNSLGVGYRKRYVPQGHVFHDLNVTIQAPNRRHLTINGLDLDIGLAGQD